MCTLRLAPPARLMGSPARLKAWLPSTPEMLNAAGFPVEPSMLQCTGVSRLPPGRASLSVTPVAVPAPVLLKVTVKPIDVPAETLAASGDVVMVTLAGLQVIVARLLPPPSLVLVAVAVLL